MPATKQSSWIGSPSSFAKPTEDRLPGCAGLAMTRQAESPPHRGYLQGFRALLGEDISADQCNQWCKEIRVYSCAFVVGKESVIRHPSSARRSPRERPAAAASLASKTSASSARLTSWSCSTFSSTVPAQIRR